MQLQEKITPLYTIYWYTDFLYRVIKFHRRSDGIKLPSDLADSDALPMDRFEQSYCRSRSMVLQYALCNQWDYFLTITVDPKKFDRWDLDRIYRYLSQWFRDYRKKHSKLLKYLLVPERHKDGAWHFHGFISGVSPAHISNFVPGIHPDKLIKAGYFNFGQLASVVGYVSLAALRDPVAAAFYVTKYITKEHAHDDFYQHLYYVSRGLRRARAVADCYIPNMVLDNCLERENAFCSSGWARTSNVFFPYNVDDVEPRDLQDLFPDLVPASADMQRDSSNLIFVQ